nr:wiskott-Aldrich syndrome protein homolog 1-like [Aegilops tauschii subsp. strangulata]
MASPGSTGTTRRRRRPPRRPPPSSSSSGAGVAAEVPARSSSNSSRLPTAGRHASRSSSSRRRPGRPARTPRRGSFTRTLCLYRAPPVPGFFGARPASHQALYAAPQSYPPAPLYGPSAAYGLPSAGGFAAPPPQPLPSAPALPPAPWDPALLAVHTVPMPQQYTGGGDWYMDTEATAHMAANPGCPYPDGAPPM